MAITSHQVDAVVGDDVPVTVRFEYEPEQAPVYAPNDKAQAPFPSQITLTSVSIYDDNKDLWRDMLNDLSTPCLHRLAEKCRQHIEGEDA